MICHYFSSEIKWNCKTMLFDQFVAEYICNNIVPAWWNSITKEVSADVIFWSDLFSLTYFTEEIV